MNHRSASFIILLLVLPAAFALISVPVNARAQQARDADDCYGENTDSIRGGIGYVSDKTLGHTVVYEDVAEKSVSSNQAYWEAHPCFRKYQFSGYPYPNPFGLGPTIYFYPVRDSYQSLYPTEAGDSWLAQVESLRTVLRDRPSWQPPTWRSGEKLATAPLLPVINAATVYLARQKYVNFPAGVGVSYIGQVTQEPRPPSQNDTFFIFQGITEKDEFGYQFYISAIFPVFLASSAAPVGGSDPYEDARLIADELQKADNASFNVDLTILDTLVGSFRRYAGMPYADDPLHGMPDSGVGSFIDVIKLLLVMVLVLLSAGVVLRLRSRDTTN